MVSEVSNTLEDKQVLFFKQASVTRKKILNKKKTKKKQGKNQQRLQTLFENYVLRPEITALKS